MHSYLNHHFLDHRGGAGCSPPLQTALLLFNMRAKHTWRTVRFAGDTEDVGGTCGRLKAMATTKTSFFLFFKQIRTPSKANLVHLHHACSVNNLQNNVNICRVGTYASIYLPTYLPTYLPACLPTYLPTYLHLRRCEHQPFTAPNRPVTAKHDQTERTLHVRSVCFLVLLVTNW